MNRVDELKAVSKELKEALKNCDSQAIDRIVADEYSGISVYGTIEGKTDILDSFIPELLKITEYTVKDEKVEIFGDIGIITGRGKISGSFQESRFCHHVLFTDVFLYTARGWRYIKSQATEIKSTDSD